MSCFDMDDGYLAGPADVVFMIAKNLNAGSSGDAASNYTLVSAKLGLQLLTSSQTTSVRCSF